MERAEHEQEEKLVAKKEKKMQNKRKKVEEHEEARSSPLKKKMVLSEEALQQHTMKADGGTSMKAQYAPPVKQLTISPNTQAMFVAQQSVNQFEKIASQVPCFLF